MREYQTQRSTFDSISEAKMPKTTDNKTNIAPGYSNSDRPEG